jgi:hypothetical protein
MGSINLSNRFSVRNELDENALNIKASIGNLIQLGRAITDDDIQAYQVTPVRVIVCDVTTPWPNKILATYEGAKVLNRSGIETADGDQIVLPEYQVPSAEVIVMNHTGSESLVRLTPGSIAGVWFWSILRVRRDEATGELYKKDAGMQKGHFFGDKHPVLWKLQYGSMNKSAYGRALKYGEVAAKHVFLAAWALGMSVNVRKFNDADGVVKNIERGSEMELAYFEKALAEINE